MKYHVTILPRAKRQILDQAIWWSEHRSAEQAFRWLAGIEQALASLGQNPQRCDEAREGLKLGISVRELHYGVRGKSTHRIVFEIRGQEVIVYCVRHLAERDLKADDIH